MGRRFLDLPRRTSRSGAAALITSTAGRPPAGALTEHAAEGLGVRQARSAILLPIRTEPAPLEKNGRKARG